MQQLVGQQEELKQQKENIEARVVRQMEEDKRAMEQQLLKGMEGRNGVREEDEWRKKDQRASEQQKFYAAEKEYLAGDSLILYTYLCGHMFIINCWSQFPWMKGPN